MYKEKTVLMKYDNSSSVFLFQSINRIDERCDYRETKGELLMKSGIKGRQKGNLTE